MAMTAVAQASGEHTPTEGSFDEKLCKTPMFIPPALKKLLSHHKDIDAVDTLERVLEATKEYIYKKNLFNAQNPVMIDASNDELGKLLGVEMFSLMEIKRILLRLLLAENRENAKLLQLPINKEITNSKRKKETFSDVCASSPIDTAPTKYICSDTRHRLTPYHTVSDESSCNSDIEDGSNSSDSESDISFSGENIFAEMYDVEYEIETDHSSCESSFSTDSEIEGILHFTALTEMAASESDEAFLADQSSNDDFSLSESSDDEISTSDKWICAVCGSLNKPTIRFCMKCYEERSEWLSEKETTEKTRQCVKGRRRRKKKSSTTESKEKKENVSSAEATSRETEDLCLFCCSSKKNSVIVHGRTGHNVSCYKCSKRLFMNNKSCPIDRRPIDKVIYLL